MKSHENQPRNTNSNHKKSKFGRCLEVLIVHNHHICLAMLGTRVSLPVIAPSSSSSPSIPTKNSENVDISLTSNGIMMMMTTHWLFNSFSHCHACMHDPFIDFTLLWEKCTIFRNYKTPARPPHHRPTRSSYFESTAASGGKIRKNSPSPDIKSSFCPSYHMDLSG